MAKSKTTTRTRRPALKAKTKRPASKSSDKPTSKQDAVLGLLRRQNGASLDEIVAATDWQPHSARGFLTAVVKKRLKTPVISEKGEDGVRRYYVAPLRG